MSEIKEMIQEFHGNAVIKGFYQQPTRIISKMVADGHLDADVKAVKDAFVAQRLMLIVSELSEALEASRKDRKADIDGFEHDQSVSSSYFKEDFERNIKDSFEDEMADATIRICDLAGWLGIDLQRHIALKHTYNLGREFMHGKKF